MGPSLDALTIGTDAGATLTDASSSTNDGIIEMSADGMVCGTLSVSAQAATRPVDIVGAIDSSPSMRDEINTIQASLNDFAARIGASSLDYRVISIGSDHDLEGGVDIRELHDHIAICVPPPLSGAAGCPDTDSEGYLHVRELIHSADTLEGAINSFPTWRDLLRPEARLHFIVVSDDDHRRNIARDDPRRLRLFPELLRP